jgi:putative transposase
MRHALLVIREDAATRKQRLQHEHDGRKRPRLQMLSLLASGQAHTRREVAQLRGVHRHTIGHWLARDATGGLETWLDLYVPAGQPCSLPPHVLAAIAQALREPSGFASDEALRQGVKQTHHLEVNDHTRDTIVCTRFTAKLKVPRPSHTKNPEAIPAFQETCLEQLQRVIPPETIRPVRVFSQDESRFGWLTVHRRLPPSVYSPSARCSTSLNGCMSMGPWRPRRVSGSSSNSPLSTRRVSNASGTPSRRPSPTA